MATAPLLLLIVAAVHPADATRAPALCAHIAAPVVRVAAPPVAQTDAKDVVAVAPALPRRAKSPPPPAVVVARLFAAPAVEPALPARREPAVPRGPPGA